MKRIAALLGIALSLAPPFVRAADVVRAPASAAAGAVRPVTALDRATLREVLGGLGAVRVARIGPTNLAGATVPAVDSLAVHGVTDRAWLARWTAALTADDVVLAGGPCPLVAAGDSLPPARVEFRWADSTTHGYVRADLGTGLASAWMSGKVADCLTLGTHARELLALVREVLPRDQAAAPPMSAFARGAPGSLDSLVPPPGSSPRAPKPPSPPEALPKLGEYVYVDELPLAITKVAPVYPASAREAGIAGQVMVEALVMRDGSVGDVFVVKSIPELDAAAVEAVRQWRFQPAKAHSVTVAVWVAVPLKFGP